MALSPCTDLSPADWIARSGWPWDRLVGFGPAGFEAHARLRFLPDPAYDGQSENDAEPGERRDTDQLLTLFDALAAHTDTPHDCYFCLWEGWGSTIHGDGPKVEIPNRAYFLFHGPLADADDWGAAEMWPGEPRLWMPEPAFVWPADHAWCVAKDVDPHWAGIGATASVIEQLCNDPRLDVVPANPEENQPAYR